MTFVPNHPRQKLCRIVWKVTLGRYVKCYKWFWDGGGIACRRTMHIYVQYYILQCRYIILCVYISSRMSHYVHASFFKYTALVECNKARHYEGVIIVFAIWKIRNITWHPHRQHTRFKRTYTVGITRAHTVGVKVRFRPTTTAIVLTT